MLFAGALTLLVGLAIGERVQLGDVSSRALIALAYLVVPGSIIAYTAFIWLLQSTSLSTATTYAYVNPAVALFLGWAVADEAVGAVTLASAAIIVVAVAVVIRRDRTVVGPTARPKTVAAAAERARRQRAFAIGRETG